MAEYETTTEAPSLSGFLEQAALVTDVDRYEAKTDAITLMTLHAAKGWNSRSSSSPGWRKVSFHSCGRWRNRETLEEERRLFYVGANTRQGTVVPHACAHASPSRPGRLSKVAIHRGNPREYLDVENLIPDTELEPGGLGYDAPARTWRTGFQDPQRRARTVARRDAEPDFPRAGIALALQAGRSFAHPKFGEGRCSPSTAWATVPPARSPSAPASPRH